MAFQIATATNKEDADVADVHLKAMQDNLLLHAQFPTTESLDWLQDFLAKDTNEHRDDAGKGVLIARDPGNAQIASFVKWLVHQPSSDTHGATSEEWPPDSRTEYLDSYGDLTAKARQDVMGDNPYYRKQPFRTCAFPRLEQVDQILKVFPLWTRC